ncbi:MAG: hypothetical protein IPJ36_11860 [Simplicispira sp.]|nr:hypothetical protein [Simplicispira sp.]
MAALPKTPNELIDQFIIGPTSSEAVNAAYGLQEGSDRAGHVSRAGPPPGATPPAPWPRAGTNQRNGKSAKTVLTLAKVRCASKSRATATQLRAHPDSCGRERRFTGFDETIIALYARYDHMREIQGSCARPYGTDVSAEFISSVTEAAWLK